MNTAMAERWLWDWCLQMTEARQNLRTDSSQKRRTVVVGRRWMKHSVVLIQISTQFQPTDVGISPVNLLYMPFCASAL